MHQIFAVNYDYVDYMNSQFLLRFHIFYFTTFTFKIIIICGKVILVDYAYIIIITNIVIAHLP